MLRRIGLLAAMGLGFCWSIGCEGGRQRSAAANRPVPAVVVPQEPPPKNVPTSVGRPLFAMAAPAGLNVAWRRSHPGLARDPIVIPECRVRVIQKEDVPSLRDGALVFIGTEIKASDPPDQVKSVTLGTETWKYRPLHEGDKVQANQLLAQLDNRVARDDCAIKQEKLKASRADFQSAEKTRNEAKNRYDRRRNLGTGVSLEEIDAARLMWERYAFDASNKKALIALAERELHQAETTLKMHEVRSLIPGVITAIHKKPGEFVKVGEPVLEIQNLGRLRIEGMVNQQYWPRLHPGMTVVVEHAQWSDPLQTLLGHQGEISCLAVSKDPDNPLIVSASEDGTVRVWGWETRNGRRRWRQRRQWRLPGVKAVACTPPTAKGNWCITGGDDGKISRWDLDAPSDQPVRIFKYQHRQAIRGLAFSPDGKSCASGGDDHEIYLWDVATGELRYRFPAELSAAITSLQFLPQSQVISASQDYTVRLWQVGDEGARLLRTVERRSGDVSRLGASPDGKRVVVDKGKMLQILSLPEGLTEGVVQNSATASNFKTFALFSPDSKMILTTGGSDGRLQLWQAPANTARAVEIRELVPAQRSLATCAAFAPDGSFLVTGTQDQQILVWALPAGDLAQPLTATITFVDPVVESSAGRVRIWAVVSNPEGRLRPGTSVTMVVDNK